MLGIQLGLPVFSDFFFGSDFSKCRCHKKNGAEFRGVRVG